MSENNRRYARYEVQINVRLTLADNEPIDMKTRDISEGGMFLDSQLSSNFPIGEMVHVQYKNPLRDNEETELDAIVVRIIDGGIGLAFIEMDAF